MNRYFTDEEYGARLAAVRADMAERGMDALLVTGPENITYLTGYTTPGYHIFQCLIVPAEGDVRFVVRNTERVNVPDLPWISDTVPIEVQALTDPIPTLLSAIRQAGLAGKRNGVDRRSLFLPPLYYDQLRGELPDLIDASGLVERHRARKSAAEIALIQRATGLAEGSITAGLESLRAAETDSDVAAAVLATLARSGSEYTGSPAYIVPGVSSLVTHSTHAQRSIGDQEPLRMEVCASKGRYHGVLTRTVTRGEPTGQLRDMVALSAAAGEAMRAAARPGVPIGEVDRAGRSLVEAEFPAAYWPNRGGYSMGISYPPGLGEGDVLDIRAGDTRPIEVGMVFHLLPTLRVPGLGAVGCTDILAVEQDATRFLTTLPRTVLSAAQ
ncbi:M24 family metallopeptidase [Dactylosporangium sp. CA-139114]|uniref:M24 family metallopeptidase n=1 Tax=Dactylosporangium sp. CA-139114 TaxID=3239931 RepID=UPI003D97A77A